MERITCVVCNNKLKSEFEQERLMCLYCDNKTEKISKELTKQEKIEGAKMLAKKSAISGVWSPIQNNDGE